jgi:hypothetical protein
MSVRAQRGYLLIGLSIALGVSMLAGIGLWNALGSANKEKARIAGEYEAFKVGVENIGKQAEKDKAAALKNQKEAYDGTIKNWTFRHQQLAAKYERLRNAAGNSSSGSGVQPVPGTTRPADDAARDNRLREVLRIAEVQTLQLILWQEWAEANKNSCGAKK